MKTGDDTGEDAPEPTALSSRGLGRVNRLTEDLKHLPSDLKRLVMDWRVVWAVVAVACVVAGIVASIMGAHAVARSDAASVGKMFPRTSAGIERTLAAIASELKPAIQHEEDLVIGASTFFAGHPKASVAEFNRWVKWSEALHRYPELEKLGLVALVPATAPSALAKQRWHAPALGGRRAAARGLCPPGRARRWASLLLGRSRVGKEPCQVLTADYCVVTPGLLSSRDTGRSVYVRASWCAGRLGIETPVYRGTWHPPSRAAEPRSWAGCVRRWRPRCCWDRYFETTRNTRPASITRPALRRSFSPAASHSPAHRARRSTSTTGGP